MLAIVSEPILNLADTAMIGRLGVAPLGAKAIASALIGGIYWIFTFLIFGTTTLVARHHGAGRHDLCGETYLHALLLAVAGGGVVALLGILFAPALYSLMGAQPTVLAEGVPYFRIRIAGATFTFVFYASVGFLRGVQDTRTPLNIALAVNGLNLILDYALIYGRLGFPTLRLEGAAIASLSAQLIGAFACLGFFFLSSATRSYRAARWSTSMTRLLPLFRIGRDLAIRTGALRFSLVFATGSVARMGAKYLSAYEIALQLFLLSSDTIDGLAVAGQDLAAKHLGAGRADRAYRMGKALIAYGAAAGLIFTIGYFTARPWLIAFFTASPEVILILAGEVFLLLALLQPFNGVVFVLDGYLIGAHDTRFLMSAMLIGALGIFVPLCWLSLHWDWGLTGVWVGLSLLMVFRFATNFGRFLSMRWINRF